MQHAYGSGLAPTLCHQGHLWDGFLDRWWHGSAEPLFGTEGVWALGVTGASALGPSPHWEASAGPGPAEPAGGSRGTCSARAPASPSRKQDLPSARRLAPACFPGEARGHPPAGSLRRPGVDPRHRPTARISPAIRRTLFSDLILNGAVFARLLSCYCLCICLLCLVSVITQSVLKS